MVSLRPQARVHGPLMTYGLRPPAPATVSTPLCPRPPRAPRAPMRDEGRGAAKTAGPCFARAADTSSGDQSLLGKRGLPPRVVISHRGPACYFSSHWIDCGTPKTLLLQGPARLRLLVADRQGELPPPRSCDWSSSAVSNRLPAAGRLMDGAGSQSAWASCPGGCVWEL